MWCKFGHVTLGHPRQRNPRTPPCGLPLFEQSAQCVAMRYCEGRTHTLQVTRECRPSVLAYASNILFRSCPVCIFYIHVGRAQYTLGRARTNPPDVTLLQWSTGVGAGPRGWSRCRRGRRGARRGTPGLHCRSTSSEIQGGRDPLTRSYDSLIRGSRLPYDPKWSNVVRWGPITSGLVQMPTG